MQGLHVVSRGNEEFDALQPVRSVNTSPLPGKDPLVAANYVSELSHQVRGNKISKEELRRWCIKVPCIAPEESGLGFSAVDCVVGK